MDHVGHGGSREVAVFLHRHRHEGDVDLRLLEGANDRRCAGLVRGPLHHVCLRKPEFTHARIDPLDHLGDEHHELATHVLREHDVAARPDDRGARRPPGATRIHPDQGVALRIAALVHRHDLFEPRLVRRTGRCGHDDRRRAVRKVQDAGEPVELELVRVAKLRRSEHRRRVVVADDRHVLHPTAGDQHVRELEGLEKAAAAMLLAVDLPVEPGRRVKHALPVRDAGIFRRRGHADDRVDPGHPEVSVIAGPLNRDLRQLDPELPTFVSGTLDEAPVLHLVVDGARHDAELLGRPVVGQGLPRLLAPRGVPQIQVVHQRRVAPAKGIPTVPLRVGNARGKYAKPISVKFHYELPPATPVALSHTVCCEGC